MVFTSKKIAALKPREKRFSLVIEKGLTIRVHPSGKKSWVVRVPQNGRVLDLTLGHFPDISLAQAKQLARKHQKRLEVDPIGGYVLSDNLSYGLLRADSPTGLQGYESANPGCGWGTISASATNSSSVYSGSKLQPSALQLLACIRV